MIPKNRQIPLPASEICTQGMVANGVQLQSYFLLIIPYNVFKTHLPPLQFFLHFDHQRPYQSKLLEVPFWLQIAGKL